MPDPIPTAVVTGASRGFGRAIAAALVASGSRVVGIARTEQRLQAVRDDLGADFVPVVADASGDELAREVIRAHRPTLLVLNAGIAPPMAPIQDQTWETFGRNWEADTRHVFAWTRAALREPLPPGSAIVVISSKAALVGSPRSGGYGPAKAAVRFITRYATIESIRAGLGIRFVTLLPGLTPDGGVGMVGVTDYAAAQGVDQDTFVAGLQPILTAEHVGKAVLEVARNRDSAAEYELSGSGLHAIS